MSQLKPLNIRARHGRLSVGPLRALVVVVTLTLTAGAHAVRTCNTFAARAANLQEQVVTVRNPATNAAERAALETARDSTSLELEGLSQRLRLGQTSDVRLTAAHRTALEGYTRTLSRYLADANLTAADRTTRFSDVQLAYHTSMREAWTAEFNDAGRQAFIRSMNELGAFLKLADRADLNAYNLATQTAAITLASSGIVTTQNKTALAIENAFSTHVYAAQRVPFQGPALARAANLTEGLPPKFGEVFPNDQTLVSIASFPLGQNTFWAYKPDSAGLRFFITNPTQYAAAVFQLKNSLGEPFSSVSRDRLAQGIHEANQLQDTYFPFATRSGAPGFHAEIRGIDSIIEYANSSPNFRITGTEAAGTAERARVRGQLYVHTVQTGNPTTNGSSVQGCGFHCCPGCSAFVRGFVTTTSGGGTYGAPTR